MIIAPNPVPNNKITLEPLNTPDQEACTKFMYVQAIDYTYQIYTYQTVQFPVLFNQGYQYILLCYDYDINAILTDTMKNRSESEVLRSYIAVRTSLVQRFLWMLIHKLYNYSPSGLKYLWEMKWLTSNLFPCIYIK